MHSRSFLAAGLSLFTIVSAGAVEKLNKRTPDPATTLPDGWTYSGCYKDDLHYRVLDSAKYTDNAKMSASSCIAFCNQVGFPAAGTEWSEECWCGFLASTATKVPDYECNKGCTADSVEACGGAERLTVYTNGDQIPPTINPGSSGYRHIGCYTDSVYGRALSTDTRGEPSSGGMTVEYCTALCKSKNFLMAGVEYGSECYCGNELDNGSSPASSGCDMVCAGDSKSWCGGRARMNLYREIPALPHLTDYVGCYADSRSARALPDFALADQGDSMTPDRCAAACRNAGAIYAGLEYGRECWCGTEIGNGNTLTTDGDAGCNIPCTGELAAYCGGKDRLTVLKLL